MSISWTAKKQITFFSFFVLVLLGFFSLVWFKMSEPTCFDERKNQKEQGIDCGGPCEKECLGVIKDFKILWVKPLQIKEGNYDVIAVVENPNLYLAAKSVHYQIKLYDKKNILIASRDGQTFISPSPKFAIFETNLSTGNRIPARAYLEFEEKIKWELYKGATPNLIVVKKEYLDDPRASISAVISNKSLETAENIVATAIIYDEEDNAIAASATKIDFIKGGSEHEAYFSWPGYYENYSRDEIMINTQIVPVF